MTDTPQPLPVERIELLGMDGMYAELHEDGMLLIKHPTRGHECWWWKGGNQTPVTEKPIDFVSEHNAAMQPREARALEVDLSELIRSFLSAYDNGSTQDRYMAIQKMREAV